MSRIYSVQQGCQAFGSIGGKWTELDLERVRVFLGVDIPDLTGIRDTFLSFPGLLDKDLFVQEINNLSICIVF